MMKQLQFVSDAVQVWPLEFVQTPLPLQHGRVVEHCWPPNEQAAMSAGG